MIPNDEQREAFLLQVRSGSSIAEIAVIQEVSEATVQWRLNMARKALTDEKDEKDEKKSRAFLGFGTLEALAEALKPKPIPPEVGERLWEKIAERIERGDFPDDLDAPPSSQPPAAAVPTPTPSTPPTLPKMGALTKAKVGAVLLVALAIGAGVWVRKAERATAPAMTVAREEVPPSSNAAPSAAANEVPSTPAALPTAQAEGAAPSTQAILPGVRAVRTRRAPSRAAPQAHTTPPPVQTLSPLDAEPDATQGRLSTLATQSTTQEADAPDGDASQRLLARMREAMRSRHFTTVLALASDHAKRFGVINARQREALVVEALRETGQTENAVQHGRATLLAYPESRGAIERATYGASPPSGRRAAGQALP